MARLSEENQRRKVQRDFYRFFRTLSPDRREGIIDSLTVDHELAVERERKASNGASDEPAQQGFIDLEDSGDGKPDQ